MLTEKEVAGYKCVEIHNGDNLPTIVMLHGYGANMRDLSSLATVSTDLTNFNWIFPNGPLQVPIGPHMMGNAWFPIDMSRFETGIIGDLYSSSTPKGMNEASDQFESLLTELNLDNIIIGGFSQGSMIALESALRNKFKFKGVILLSSTLVNRELLNERKASIGCPLFQSHGEGDMVLPINFARDLKNELEGLDFTYHEFKGGHEIPPSALFDMISFLKKL